MGPDTLDLDKDYEVAYVTRQAVPPQVGRDHGDRGIRAVAAMEALLEQGPYDREDVNTHIPV